MSFRLTLVSVVESSLPVGDRTGEGRGQYAKRHFAPLAKRRWTDKRRRLCTESILLLKNFLKRRAEKSFW